MKSAVNVVESDFVYEQVSIILEAIAKNIKTFSWFLASSLYLIH
ncbi:MAG: hypothetical protein AAF630_01690 [Cyanobacteria bacterium P01_C01_bin.38]